MTRCSIHRLVAAAMALLLCAQPLPAPAAPMAAASTDVLIGRSGLPPVPTDRDAPPDPVDPPPPTDPLPPTTQGSSTQVCAADLDGNGDAAGPGELAACTAAPDGSVLCPIARTACIAEAGGATRCPLDASLACTSIDGVQPPSCSASPCIDLAAHRIETEPVVDDPGAPADGPVDADGNCLGTIEIFGGRALRCRPPGASTSLSDCCKDKGKIVKDGMGSSIGSLGTKIAIAKGVFTGMKAAYAAFSAGATAGEAASAGAHALVVGIDPTSIAVSLAVSFMIEVLLQGCDAQDMETGMLRGSGMCHEVGSYCASSVLGICIQKAKSHCCFNTRLGRIIQEQGRPQLKSFAAIGWGPVKHPLCGGFTPNEFQALDFSRMDLSEYYADIEARAQSAIQIDMKDRVDAYMQTIGK